MTFDLSKKMSSDGSSLYMTVQTVSAVKHKLLYAPLSVIANFKTYFNRMIVALKDPGWASAYIKGRLFALVPKDPESLRIGSWGYGHLPRVCLRELFPGIEQTDVIILKTFDRVPATSLDPLEILVLAALARFRNAKNILEIGTFDGNTALNLAANSSADAWVTTVDLPVDWNGDLSLNVPTCYINVTDRRKIGRQFRDTTYAKKIKQVYGDSARMDWATTLQPPFDLIFIDGCHHRRYVESDTRNALQTLKPGGIVVWHDYGMIRDVSLVVDQIAGKIEVRAIRGTRLAIGSKASY
jgi:predicted O-methyltransferase YrrM